MVKSKKYPCLYVTFDLGDRVKRFYKDKNGKQKEYKGIVLAIDDDSIEIYWDARDGKYRPNDMNMAFTNCRSDEIFSGCKGYSPIEKEQRWF